MDAQTGALTCLPTSAVSSLEARTVCIPIAPGPAQGWAHGRHMLNIADWVILWDQCCHPILVAQKLAWKVRWPGLCGQHAMQPGLGLRPNSSLFLPPHHLLSHNLPGQTWYLWKWKLTDLGHRSQTSWDWWTLALCTSVVGFRPYPLLSEWQKQVPWGRRWGGERNAPTRSGRAQGQEIRSVSG